MVTNDNARRAITDCGVGSVSVRLKFTGNIPRPKPRVTRHFVVEKECHLHGVFET